MPYNEASWERNQLVKKPSNGDTAGNSVGVGGGDVTSGYRLGGMCTVTKNLEIYVSNLKLCVMKMS